MKEFILNCGIVAALILGGAQLFLAITMIAESLIIALALLLGGTLSISQVIVLRFVANAIEKRPADKPSHSTSDTAGTPWADDPGHTND